MIKVNVNVYDIRVSLYMDIVLTSHMNEYEWISGLDSDGPTNDGDYQTLHRFSRNEVCENPIALDARPRTSGSTEVTHTSLTHGFWCNNEEQSQGTDNNIIVEKRFNPGADGWSL